MLCFLENRLLHRLPRLRWASAYLPAARWAVTCLAALAWCNQAPAQSIAAASPAPTAPVSAAIDGTSQTLWLFRPIQTPKGTRGGVFVQREDNPDGRLMIASVLSEPPPAQMATSAIVVEGDSIWVVGRGGSIGHFRLVERPPGPAKLVSSPMPNLPEGLKPLSLARAGGQTFVLCRVTNGQPIDSLLLNHDASSSSSASTTLTQEDMAELLGVAIDELPARFQVLPSISELGPPEEGAGASADNAATSVEETGDEPESLTTEPAAQATETPEAITAEDPAQTPAPPAPAYDVLLVRDRLAWAVVPMPADWPVGDGLNNHRGLLISHPEQDRPTLLSHAPAPAPGSTPESGSRGTATSEARLFAPLAATEENTSANWATTNLGDLRAGGPAPLHLDATLVDRQIILAASSINPSATNSQTNLQVKLFVLRPNGNRPLKELATVKLDTPVNAGWGLVPRGHAVDVYASIPEPPEAPGSQAPQETNQESSTASDSSTTSIKPGDPPLIRLIGQRVTLGGRIKPAPPVEEYRRTPLDRSLDFVILVLVLAVSTLVVVFIWPREIKNNKLYLPKAVMLAMPGRRMMGAFVDAMPCFWIARRLFDQTNDQILWFWPGMGHAQRAEDLYPALAVIGLYTLHTTLTELFFQRSLGKFIFRTRLTDLQGHRLSSTQLLIRGIMKPLDLIGLPLLTMALFHNRQRFGDLLAKTVLTQEKPKHLLEEEAQNPQERQDPPSDSPD